MDGILEVIGFLLGLALRIIALGLCLFIGFVVIVALAAFSAELLTIVLRDLAPGLVQSGAITGEVQPTTMMAVMLAMTLVCGGIFAGVVAVYIGICVFFAEMY